MSQSKTPTSKPRLPRQKKLRWQKRLFFTTLIITLLVGILQGPGLRYAATTGIAKGLTSAGLEGSFIVDGSLFSGIQLLDVHIKGKGQLRELHVGKLTVEYKLSRLIRGKIDALVADNIHVWVDLNQHDPNKTEKPEDTDDSPSEVNLEKIRQMVLPIGLNITHSSILISQGDDHLWNVKEFSITHARGAEDFNLFFGEFIDLDDNTTVNQETVLTWEHNRVCLTHFPLHSKVQLSEVICVLDNITPTHIQVKTSWENSDFTINLDHLKKARIELTQGEIILDRLAPLLKKNGITPAFGGSINELNISVPDIMAPPAKMRADLRITGQQLYWEKYKIQRLHINASMADARVEINSELNVAQEKASAIKAIATLDTSNPATASDWTSCWHNAKAEIELSIHEPEKIVAWAGVANPPGGWPTGAIHLFAKGSLIGDQPGDASAQLEWLTPHWAKLDSKDIRLTATWDHTQQSAAINLVASQLASGNVTAYAEYSVPTKKYSGNFHIKDLDIKKLQPALKLFKLETPRAGLVNLTWNGKGTGGDLQSYEGTITADIQKLDAEPTSAKQNQSPPKSNIKLTAEYSPGLNLKIDDLQVSRANLTLKLNGSWQDNWVKIPLLELHDTKGILAKGSITLPLSHDIKSLDTLRAQPGDIDIALDIDKLPFSNIFKQLPNVKQPVTGNLTSHLKITGTLAEPSLNFITQAKSIKVIGKETLPETGVEIKLFTKNKTVFLEGLVDPKGHQKVNLSGQIPFNLNQWIDQPDSFLNTPLQAKIDTHTIDLAPYSFALTIASHIEGTLLVQTELAGTLKKPIITSTAKAKIKRLYFKSEKIPDIRNLNFNLTFKDNILTISPSKAVAAGGKYNLKGTVNFKEFTNPIFNIDLTADKALIIRDDKMIIRADAALKLTGPYKKAHISGNVGITQSLFYKDIQIMPLGGNDAAAPLPGKSQLPSFTQPRVAKDTPEGNSQAFKNWTLDVKVYTKDDFLIRGNLATGNATAKLIVKGTVGDPKPNGKVSLKKLEASLPFSQLNITNGEVIFTPETGFDPRLNFKATSRVGSTDVEITIYGKASSPKHLFSSNPPLPENEIVFLLATGTTSEKLMTAGSAAAAGKAYQLLLDTWLRSNPERFKKLKHIISMLNKTVNINIGGTDQFTGKQFNSATIKVHDRWYVIASMDLENNTRGLLLYTIRFK